MSANLLDGIKPRLMSGTTESDGIFHHAAGKATNSSHDDWLMWDLPDQAALATNQTYHIGLSVRGTSANGTSLHVTIGYKDAAEKKNYVTSSALAIGTSWGRVERTLVVPSGMRPFAFYVAAYGTYPEVWMAAPTLSLGSPLVLTQAEVTVSYIKDGKSPTISVSKSGTVTTITVTNPDGSKSTQKVLDGTNGTPGAKGADGRTTYTHVKYSNDNGETFTSNSGEDAGAYIGICTDFSSEDPTAVLSYKWAKIKGDTGAAIKSVTRYYQLVTSGSSAPSVPASSSKLGSWTASEPSANTAKDLWQCECTKYDDGTETWSAATKSSAYEAAKSVSTDVKKLSDKVTATVSEQMKWNGSYASRTSSLEQTAEGISASLDSMSSTDASIHQWMSFGRGTDGKPTLTIGTSDGDIVSRQTNSGLSYETRGGTKLMELDGASRSSTMPHVHADDVSIGSWQWVPTKNGTHFTLMWIGG